MKGIVLTEFLEMTESSYGLEVTDRIITKGCPFHMGFTAVGSYDHRELIAMVEELSRETKESTRDLIITFGRHLFHSFRHQYPEYFQGIDGTEAMLLQVNNVVHVEVTKLSPDSELPTFRFRRSEDGAFFVEYESVRPFADLCEGLLEASIEHYGEDFKLLREDLPGIPGTHALFSFLPKR